MAYRRTAADSGSHNGGDFGSAIDWDALSSSSTRPLKYQSVDAEAAEESETFDVAAQTGIKGLPVRQITLAEGISFKSLMTRQIDLERQKYGRMLFWARIALGTLYALVSLGLLFTVIFASNGLMPLYEDPLRFSTLDNKWEAALEKVGTVHVDWALLALLFTFALYHYAHFLGILSDPYLRLVFYYQMNVIRWVFHGVVGGLMVGFFYPIVMGVSSVIVAVLLTLAVVAAAAGMLFSEMINMPTIYNITEGDTRESLMKKYALNSCEAGMALKRGWFIKREAVTPWVLLFAVIAVVAYIGVVSYYFWVAVDDKFSKVPWYAWTTYFITVISLLAMIVVNAAALLLNFSFLKNYFYIDLVHNVVEVLLILVNTLLIIVGFSTAA